MREGFVEIRLYKLKPGTRERFHGLFSQGVSEMLARYKINVIGHGPSAHDADSYFLMRAYSSLEERNAVLGGFYGSDEWKAKYDPYATEMIEAYHTIVLEASNPAVRALAAMAQA